MNKGIVRKVIEDKKEAFPENKCTILYQLKNKIYRKETIICKDQLYSEYTHVYTLKAKTSNFADFMDDMPIKRKPGRPKGSKNKPKAK